MAFPAKITVFILLIFSLTTGSAQHQLDYYFGDQVSLNTDIPTPEAILGFQVGALHASHDQVMQYMYALAQASDRVTIKETGRTYEKRPLLLLTITHPDNHKNLEAIKSEHVKLTDPSKSGQVNISNMPVVIYQGYSVHGNEPSGGNAALLVAYYMAAANTPEVETMLKNVIFLLDPVMNPDGFTRFSSWVNRYKSETLVTDPNNIEQSEDWPGGRTNHYWFDLNRDWLVAIHPESQARIKSFHEWKPNILTDFHEMGTNATYFFQPGIPSRNHPLTPERTFELTEKIARYHGAALDSIGSLYYSKESFDDFYYGKGSTFPDGNGAIGILFEQASSRSHAQESNYGLLTFPFTIKNQFNTSLSTLRAGVGLKKELLDHQKKFFTEALDGAGKDPVKAYVFGSEKDAYRNYEFLKILKRQQIQVFELSRNLDAGTHSFTAGAAYIVPANQPQYKMVKAIFEKRTSFQDSLFYDVSAWTLPLAFNLPYSELGARQYNPALRGNAIEIPLPPSGGIAGNQAAYAYILEWEAYNAPAAVYQMLSKKLTTMVASKTFTVQNGQTFGRGTIIIPVANQAMTSSQLYSYLQEVGEKYGVVFHATNTGYTEGIKLGSPSISTLELPKAALIVGSGVSSYEAGEVWHLLDQRMSMPITKLTQERFNSADLNRYNVIIMVNGNYGTLSTDKLKNWVRSGGVLITTKSASKWAADNDITKIKFQMSEDDENMAWESYEDLSPNRGAQVIGGAIFQAKIDLTHPLGWGYEHEKISLFRNSTLFMENPKNPYAAPLRYTDEGVLSGYVSPKNLESLKESPAIGIAAFGSGRVISFSDNPNFRAFWHGTNKMFMNAIFFGKQISPVSAR